MLIHTFCKIGEHEIVLQECKSNQNKNNFMFTTLTKHVNNQTNCCIALEKLKKIWIWVVLIYLAVYIVWNQLRLHKISYSIVSSFSPLISAMSEGWLNMYHTMRWNLLWSSFLIPIHLLFYEIKTTHSYYSYNSIRLNLFLGCCLYLSGQSGFYQ